MTVDTDQTPEATPAPSQFTLYVIVLEDGNPKPVYITDTSASSVDNLAQATLMAQLMAGVI